MSLSQCADSTMIMLEFWPIQTCTVTSTKFCNGPIFGVFPNTHVRHRKSVAAQNVDKFVCFKGRNGSSVSRRMSRSYKIAAKISFSANS